MLRLPPFELKRLYTKHLLLKEAIGDGASTDLSLHILYLGFLHKRAGIYAFYEADVLNPHLLGLLYSLEDRFVNGVVLYMIAEYYYYSPIRKTREEMQAYFEAAHSVLVSKKEEALSVLEADCLKKLEREGFMGRDDSVSQAAYIEQDGELFIFSWWFG